MTLSEQLDLIIKKQKDILYVSANKEVKESFYPLIDELEDISKSIGKTQKILSGIGI